MAQAIACDLCNTEVAVLLQTNIDTGQVIAVGAACLFPFSIGTATTIAADMPYDVKQHYLGSVITLHDMFDGVTTIGASPEPETDTGTEPPADVPSHENAVEAAKSVAHTRAGKMPKPVEPAS